MVLTKAQHPFQFVTSIDLVELTGAKARSLPELYSYLKEAPAAVIYHHTHHFLKQHQFLSPEPPNDFAYWVTNVLQEDQLGEQLAAIDTVRFPSIQSLATKIVTVIGDFLVNNESRRSAPDGEEFHFMKSQSFVMPTPYIVNDLREFVEAVKKVAPHSLYHHIFQARLRLGKETNDFSHWLDIELGEKDMAKAIARLDPYTHTLENLRMIIIQKGEDRIRSLEREVEHAAR